MHESHAARSSGPAAPDSRPQRPAREERGSTKPAQDRSRPDQRGRAGTRPERGARNTHGSRGSSAPRVEGMPLDDRAPPEGQRQRRRGRGRAGRPEFDRRDPDGLGRWANRADDFD
jgi:hypothetical protein